MLYMQREKGIIHTDSPAYGSFGGTRFRGKALLWWRYGSNQDVAER
jgi:hypothetical protein